MFACTGKSGTCECVTLRDTLNYARLGLAAENRDPHPAAAPLMWSTAVGGASWQKSEPNHGIEPIYLELVELGDICFLQEVLYWVAFGRLPTEIL